MTEKKPMTDKPAGDMQFSATLSPEQLSVNRTLGMSVFNSADEDLGDVNDVIVDKSGKPGVVVIGVGGFLGIGKTVTPARTLSESDFTVIDRMRDSSITFPNAAKKYQIVSRQDTRFLAVPPDKDGSLRETLRVASPEQFWASSKFLILVER